MDTDISLCVADTMKHVLLILVHLKQRIACFCMLKPLHTERMFK